jgi:predicted dithiol-disulfide oxidoreductase (DUF899 family)
VRRDQRAAGGGLSAWGAVAGSVIGRRIGVRPQEMVRLPDRDGYFSEGQGVSTFAREGDTVYHCYSSYARGTEFLMGYQASPDRAPKGVVKAISP